MNRKKNTLCIAILLLIFLSYQLIGITVGSNSSSSRQLRTFFRSSDSNNQMVGFAVFEKGLSLEDADTTCTFDAFFPVSGEITLNGGILHLARDAVFKNPFKIGPGKIDGNSYSLAFPSNVSSIYLPSEYHNKLLSFVDEQAIGDNVNDVSWSYDDKYIAVACDSFGGSELQIFYFDGTQLILKDSYNFGSIVCYTVDWNPVDYSLAVGTSGGDELYVFSFDLETETLSQTDAANTGRVYNVAWSPNGQLLAVGRYNQNDIRVYEVVSGVLGAFYTCPLYSGELSVGTNYVQKKGLSWNTTGEHLAVSFRITLNGSTKYYIKVFSYNGSGFNDEAYFEGAKPILSIDWKPESSILAVGMSSGSTRVRLYNFNAEDKTIIEMVNSAVSESRTIYDLHWKGDLLAYLIDKANASYELKVCSFDSIDNTLSVVSGYNYTADLKTLSWSHNGNYIATGGPADNLVVLKFEEKPLIFKDIKLYFDSDIILTGNIIFEGSCILNCGRNILDISTDASITISHGATLFLEDATIKGLSGSNIVCADDDGVLQLDDIVWIQEGNFSFASGGLRFKNDVKMMGDYIFAYQSLQTSTLLSRATLALDVGLTFSYDPNSASKNLIEMEDETSLLLLNGATLHTTPTGIQLTKGRLRVLRDSFLSSEKETIFGNLLDEGITLGNDIAGDDLKCDILSGVTLHMLQGSLNYRNVLSSSWSMNNFTSVLYMYADTQYNVYQNIDLDSGSLLLGNNTIIGRAIGKSIIGSLRPQGTLLYTNI